MPGGFQHRPLTPMSPAEIAAQEAIVSQMCDILDLLEPWELEERQAYYWPREGDPDNE
jgi:hypothetical protein